MEKPKKLSTWGKALALVAVGALAGAAIGATAFPVTKTETVTQTVEVTKEVPVEVVKEVEVPVEVMKTETQYVDNGKLADVLSFLELRRGDAQIVYDDLDDDELNLAVDRMVMAADFQMLAENEVRKEYADLFDKEYVNGTKLDGDELRGYDMDSEDLVFDDIDFDDGDAEILVPIKFRDDEQKYSAVVRVQIREGEIDDLDIESLELR